MFDFVVFIKFIICFCYGKKWRDDWFSIEKCVFFCRWKVEGNYVVNESGIVRKRSNRKRNKCK